MAVETLVISGQSNAAGAAPGVVRLPSPQVTMWDPGAGGWVPAQDPLAFTDRTGLAGPNGPFVTMAHRLVHDRARTVRLTGWAKASQPIATWAEGGSSWQPLRPTLTPEATHFLFFQGEADAAAGTLAWVYAAALADLIRRVRAHTRADLPVTIVGLADPVPPYESAMYAIRSAQQGAAQEVAPPARYVPASGVPLDPTNPWHLSYDGYTALGYRLADALDGG